MKPSPSVNFYEANNESFKVKEEDDWELWANKK